ncbi:NAD(P)H-binding protein [Nonomuraea sp. NPDC050663]|uniref:NmrA family NAD(P)-binding protein n=1 Tax=Nonomuraea sp. NPDC050663 TaxID=3364370 RepID=UPI0037A396CC
MIRHTEELVLVTGATGLVGRPLVDLLLAQGVRVRAVSRRPEEAGQPDKVEVVAPGTGMFEGVRSVFLNPRAVGLRAAEFLEQARRGGAVKVVAMSALNVDHPLEHQPSRQRGDFNKEAEEAAVASGLDWCALRSGYYAVNTVSQWGAQIRAGDVVRSPFPEAAWAPLHERDLAAVAAHALLGDELLGRRPVLTGPRALTQQEMVEAIGAAIGRPLRYQAVSAQAAEHGLVRQGFSEGAARGFIAMQGLSYLQPGLVSPEVEEILGRPALGFEQWAVEHAADFDAG